VNTGNSGGAGGVATTPTCVTAPPVVVGVGFVVVPAGGAKF